MSKIIWKKWKDVCQTWLPEYTLHPNLQLCCRIFLTRSKSRKSWRRKNEKFHPVKSEENSYGLKGSLFLPIDIYNFFHGQYLMAVSSQFIYITKKHLSWSSFASTCILMNFYCKSFRKHMHRKFTNDEWSSEWRSVRISETFDNSLVSDGLELLTFSISIYLEQKLSMTHWKVRTIATINWM